MIHESHSSRKPLLEDWLDVIARSSFYRTLSDRITQKKRIELPALPGSLGVVLLAALLQERAAGLLAVLPDPEEAAKTALDFGSLLGQEKVSLLSPWNIEPYEELSPTPTLAFERHDALLRIGRLSETADVVVTAAAALTHWSPDCEELRARELHIVEGEERYYEALIRDLLKIGYKRVEMVGETGEIAVRGGLVDVAPPGIEHGIRIEFWGDVIESLREFNLRNQRTVGVVGRVKIPPVREVPADRDAWNLALERTASELDEDSIQDTPLGYALERSQIADGLEWFLPLFAKHPSSVADLISDESLVVVWDPDRVHETLKGIHSRAADRYKHMSEKRGWLHPERIMVGMDILDRLRKSHAGADLPVVASHEEDVLRTDARPAPMFSREFKELKKELNNLHRDGITTVVLVEEEGQRRRLEDLLVDESHTGPKLSMGQLERGFVWPDAGLAVLPDHEIFRRPRRSRPSRAPRDRTGEPFRSLNKGDLVVHIDHGLGRYEGLRTLEVDGQQNELLELTYAGGDKLLVPIDQMSRVRRYAGTDSEKAPSLNTIGGSAWERTVERAKEDLLEMARDLAKIYAARREIAGNTYPPDDILMEELEASFQYAETPDQIQAVEEVKKDLESSQSMDRLICGDVGYGKTEVAIRAALKVIEGGDQVAVLVPTTVLAQQHMETFRERLDSFPIRIDMLSRFRTPAQQRRTLEDLVTGRVDLVIGTHRLLSKDVQIPKLGLVVVDEEHRFGVKAKEALKSIRAQVEVLSLTATPIPRTLHMSLSGIRDISIITTPPEDRLPIHTEVVRFDEELIQDAIRCEMERGGQTFFVHNRVQSIDSAVSLIERLVPEARTGMAHGQMNERKLEQVMLEFASGEIDVLVSSMIVESGLDLPNANTLLVNRADRFGLAQLYQLRGRVGRSSEKAYAYFLVPPGRRLTRDARRRLQAVQEYSELGVGFQLAMRDLEIRGAGNLLGAQQHGHITAVGFDLYTEMLEEAVAELRGTQKAMWSPPRLELPGEVYLPESYINLPGLRLEFYRNAVDARTLEDIGKLYSELRDRFGPLPPEAMALIDVAVIRVIGAELGLYSLVVQNNRLKGKFNREWVPDRPAWEKLLERLGPDVRFIGKTPPGFETELAGTTSSEKLEETRNLLLTEDEAEYVTELIAVTTPEKRVDNG